MTQPQLEGETNPCACIGFCCKENKPANVWCRVERAATNEASLPTELARDERAEMKLNENSEQNTREDELEKTPKLEAVLNRISSVASQMEFSDNADYEDYCFNELKKCAAASERENNRLWAENKVLKEADYEALTGSADYGAIKLALADEQAKCERLEKELKDEKSYAACKDETATCFMKLQAELTATQARLAGLIDEVHKCVSMVNIQYGHTRDSNEDSKFLLFLSGKLNTFLFSTEPPAILKELESWKEMTQQRIEQVIKLDNEKASLSARLAESEKDGAVTI